jgi:actin-related protein 5
MTITSTRFLGPHIADFHALQNGSARPPERIWHAIDPPFKGHQPPPSEGYEESSSDTAIVIDNGEA